MDFSTSYILDQSSLQNLIALLQRRGYAVVGPRVSEQTIVLDVIDSADDLPRGWGDDQQPGTYRLRRRDDDAMFGFNLGPHSWKKLLFPPALKLFSARRNGKGIVLSEAIAGEGGSPSAEPLPRYAFLGVRPCELNAIAIQDDVFTGDMYADSHYAALRKQAFIIVVNCTQSAATCFCTSMNTGPGANAGYDLSLTEVVDQHHFVLQAGSSKGMDVVAELRVREARASEVDEAKQRIEHTANTMHRHMMTEGTKQVLQQFPDHPRWELVAERCLSCANCTLVCPTCFCHTIEDTTDLTGEHAERWRKWDSCFTLEFSYIHGGSIRTSRKSRYRQWLTHKLANWIDQFGTSGCVGCGRCIVWCPVGIDITEEVQALHEQTITHTLEANDHGVT